MPSELLMWLWMLIMLSGLCVAVWGFSKSDKNGYIFVAMSFILALAMFFYSMPFAGLESVDPEVQARINAAVLEVLQAESAGSGETVHTAEVAIRQSVLPFVLILVASVILVIGLWLLAWAEPTDDPDSGNVLS